MNLPCLVDKCAADNARKRLASGEALSDLERGDLALAANGCLGPQADPFDPSLRWDGCPAKAAFKRPDIEAALTLRALASMAPLERFPSAYAAGPVETWSAIDAERAAFREAR